MREERSSISNVTGYALPDVTTWVYDDNGNVLSESRVGPSAGGVTTGTVDAQERLLSWGGAIYEYGAAGERLRRVEGASEEAYSWDVYGNLLAVSLADGREVTYVVDGRGRRVGRKVDGVLERGWLYQDDLEPVAEVDAAGNVTARFVYGSRGHVPDYMVKDGRTWKFITDHLGSVVLVVDAYGTEVGQRRVYDAYGKVLYDSNPGFQPFGYAGGLEDEDTKWVRFGARDYDPETRRWTTKDPIGLSGGVNVYGYVGGDPVNLVDVTGLAPPAGGDGPTETSGVDWRSMVAAVVDEATLAMAELNRSPTEDLLFGPLESPSRDLRDSFFGGGGVDYEGDAYYYASWAAFACAMVVGPDHGKARLLRKAKALVDKGRRPSGIFRIDIIRSGHGGAEAHVGGRGSPALKSDGTWKHVRDGQDPPRLPKDTLQWLREHGWDI